MYVYIYLSIYQCEAPKIAKLVFITPITMGYGTYNYSYWAYKLTYNWGASHCIYTYICMHRRHSWICSAKICKPCGNL